MDPHPQDNCRQSSENSTQSPDSVPDDTSSVNSSLGGGAEPSRTALLSSGRCHSHGEMKALAMSDHKRAAGYNFSQPTRPEKKTVKAIPRPMSTESWPEGRGFSGHLRNFATNAAVTASESLVPMQKRVCLCCGLCL